MDRMPVHETGDGGSNPPGSTDSVLSSNWSGRHPLKVKICGFEPRLHDSEHSTAASITDSESVDPGSNPGAPAIRTLSSDR